MNNILKITSLIITKRVLILFVILLMFIAGAGCRKSPAADPVKPPEDSKQEDSLPYGDITDPVELEKLWQEYLYDSITTVGNARDFDSALEIEPLYVAEFCWLKYVSEHGKESLALADKDSTTRLFPLSVVLEYALRYFNLSSLDVSQLQEYYYDKEKDAFLFSFGDESRPSYTANNSWGERLDKVTRNSDGSVTAVLVRKSGQTDRIELTKTLILQRRDDGSLYFSKGRWEYVNNNLVALTGNYQHFNEITGYKGNMEELSMLGEVDGRLLLAATPYEEGKKPSLLLVNPDSMSLEKKLDFKESFTSTDARIKGEKILVCLKDRMISIDKSLSQIEIIFIPAVIRDKAEREPKYDQNGFPDVVFGGYDVTGDLKTFVYTDEAGVKLLNAADNSERLLGKTVSVADSQLINASYHWEPRFVANETKVITTMTGYESTMGYTLCNLQDGSEELYYITSECSSTGFIRYDTGRLEVNTHVYNHETQTGECKTFYLDFFSGEAKELKLDNPRETGDIRMPDQCFVGQDYAAYITYEHDYSDNANNMYYINRLNLKTFTTEAELVTVKAADTHILGVLTDGRVVFWYNLNPSEKGICLTK